MNKLICDIILILLFIFTIPVRLRRKGKDEVCINPSCPYEKRELISNYHFSSPSNFFPKGESSATGFFFSLSNGSPGNA
jgi:hypothetical protein